jgi:hypothetical protein
MVLLKQLFNPCCALCAAAKINVITKKILFSNVQLVATLQKSMKHIHQTVREQEGNISDLLGQAQA